jgi:predicted DNA-binding WGR domain protein
MTDLFAHSISEARIAHAHGRRFRLRFEYRGTNGRSDKFWEIEGNGSPGLVTVRWGKIGSYSEAQTEHLHEAINKAYEKEGDGYCLVCQVGSPAPAPTKLTGIVANIHRLTKKERNCYGAYDLNGDLLFDVTEAGFRELIKTNPMITITS